MAQGFLNSSNEGKDPELTGEEYFDELADRAFFQDFSMDSFGSGVSCKMHDLVHDFAQFLTGGHFYHSYNNEDTFCFNHNRNPIHLSLIYDERDVAPKSFHGSVKKVDNVRTVQCRRHKDHLFNVACLSSDLIHHLRYLRVLKLKGMGITHVPNEIDKLIHLRYLDLSRNENLNEMPDSMCDLINLQTLKLKWCKNLIKLPKDMVRMIRLKYLDIRYAGFVYLPEGIKYWKSLRTLSSFIVSATAEGCRIEELKHLNLLKDFLAIERLGRVKSAEEAAEAKLLMKSQLTALRLDFYSREVILVSATSDGQIHRQSLEGEKLTERVLGVLQPHSNLKKLTISSYLGFKFPGWMGDVRALTNLRFLRLYKCHNCTELPALGLLPSLEVLRIDDLANLKRIGVEIYGGSQCLTEVAFPKLIALRISGNDNLEVWECGNGEVQVDRMMPHIARITIRRCKKFKKLPKFCSSPGVRVRIES